MRNRGEMVRHDALQSPTFWPGAWRIYFTNSKKKGTAVAGRRVSSLPALSPASTKIHETNNTIFNLHLHPRFIGGGAGNQTR